ncbi:hypothetical protein [Phenylobacterium conjunctum]|uniref:Uncharacterized protein n=1 Tax=Phenylobacterium conjunctum TaxID=1298959 RepID=A0ABW3T5A1_9CAUL
MRASNPKAWIAAPLTLGVSALSLTAAAPAFSEEYGNHYYCEVWQGDTVKYVTEGVATRDIPNVSFSQFQSRFEAEVAARRPDLDARVKCDNYFSEGEPPDWAKPDTEFEAIGGWTVYVKRLTGLSKTWWSPNLTSAKASAPKPTRDAGLIVESNSASPKATTSGGGATAARPAAAKTPRPQTSQSGASGPPQVCKTVPIVGQYLGSPFMPTRAEAEAKARAPEMLLGCKRAQASLKEVFCKSAAGRWSCSSTWSCPGTKQVCTGGPAPTGSKQ